MNSKDILLRLLQEVYVETKLGQAAKREFENLVTRFDVDSLVIVMPLEDVDDMQDRALRDLRREGFLELAVKYEGADGHVMYINLLGERFERMRDSETKIVVPEMKDSGKRETFSTGAVRDTAEGKPRPELISPFAMERLAEWLRKGAEKYAPRNWEQGIPISRTLASLYRHLLKFQEGETDEDHMAAIMCNAMFIMHTQDMVERGVLPESLLDMPKYESTSSDEINE